MWSDWPLVPMRNNCVLAVVWQPTAAQFSLQLQKEEKTMEAPVNVEPKYPDTSSWKEVDRNRWEQEAVKWAKLNPGNPGFYPLTVKAGYVIGVINGICESVSCLLKNGGFARQTSYYPAYGIFASGVEILGRCVKGDSTSYRSTLRAGFQWLAKPDAGSYDAVCANQELIRTSQRAYTIEELEHLRNYAAHGQATAQFWEMDCEILTKLHSLLRDGLEHYWSKLTLPGNDVLSTNLANANIVVFRDWPVFKCWSLFDRDIHGEYRSVTDVFEKFGREWVVASS
jgi:hypothetical protein